jgi:hypothetical protein
LSKRLAELSFEIKRLDKTMNCFSSAPEAFDKKQDHWSNKDRIIPIDAELSRDAPLTRR